MTLIVQKYGGSSVASPERIRSVARHIARQRARGVELVVVASAMGSSTDDLLDLAHAVAPTGRGSRERDQLLATGEQVAAALLALALISEGIAVEAVEATEVGLTFYIDPWCVDSAVRVLHDRLLADPEREARDAGFGSDGDGADTPLLSHAKGAK